jgi:hypothetical protein
LGDALGKFGKAIFPGAAASLAPVGLLDQMEFTVETRTQNHMLTPKDAKG